MTEFYEDTDATELLEDLLDEGWAEFSDVKKAATRFLVRMKHKQNNEGETVACGKPVDVKKVPPLYMELVKADYILVVDQHIWNITADEDTTRAAMFHKAIVSIKVKVDNEGKAKYSKKEPEIVEYLETITRYGQYNRGLADVATLLGSAANATRDSLITGTVTQH